MPVTRLLLIRHAHTDPGPNLCGCLDIAPSHKGHTQIQRLSERASLATSPVALYTSPLTRARAVAAALTQPWRLQAQVTDAVREIDCGHMEGLAFADLQRRHPELWARNLAQADDDFCWPGGESYRTFRARVLRGLRDIATRHAGGRVAVVTHAGVISQVLGAICSRPASAWEPDRPDPFTATEIAWGADTPVAVLSYNAADWY